MAEPSKKILIAEDDGSLLSALQERFADEGFSVVTARDGEEGLIAVEKERPDLLLLDIRMPKMDGITMARKLKEAGTDLPTIFLTNLDDIRHISEAMGVSKSDYLIKSDWNPDDVTARVKAKLGL
jgi:DNA-binding response OmpR family regulator